MREKYIDQYKMFFSLLTAEQSAGHTKLRTGGLWRPASVPPLLLSLPSNNGSVLRLDKLGTRLLCVRRLLEKRYKSDYR